MRSRKKSKKFLEINENELTTVQNLWDPVKAVLRGKFMVIQAYLKKIEKSQINNLTLNLTEQEEQQQTKPRVSRKKEIIKIRSELNGKETKKTMQRTNESRTWFTEQINKTDNL